MTEQTTGECNATGEGNATDENRVVKNCYQGGHLFELTGVSLQTQMRIRLDDISLTIPAGVTAVIGYSGAGKSSLLSLLAGFERPTRGQIIRLDQRSVGMQGSGGNAVDSGLAVDAATLRPPVRPNVPVGNRHLPVFWAPQGGGLWPHLTVVEHLTAVSAARKDRDSGKTLDEILRHLDLEHRREAFPGELSQGERSRLAIGRALAAQAGILLLDEPFAHVDSARRTPYWQYVRQELNQHQTSLIFASHEPAEVIRESQTVVCLDAGKIVFSGSTITLYRNPPNRISGEFLGRLNWFGPADQLDWLRGNQELQIPECGRGLRPECLEVVLEKESELEVISSAFEGPFSETRIWHRNLRQERNVLHCSVNGGVSPGDRVRVAVCRTL